MVNYNTDEALQEIHDEMYQQEQKRPKNLFTDLSKGTKLIIGILFAVFAYYISIGKIKGEFVFGIILAVGVIYFFLQQTESKREELTNIECMIRLNDQLKFLQKHPIGDVSQVPKGEVNVELVGRKQWYEGQAFKRSYSVKIYDSELDCEEIYFAEVDLFTGDIITFKRTPEGVEGDETKDIKLMPTYDLLIQKKRDKFLDKTWKY